MIELLISSSILISVIALMRVLFRSRIPPGFQYALWLLVLLRLMLPISLLPSPASAAGAITRTVQTMQIAESPDAASQQQSGAESGAVRQDAGKTDPAQVLIAVWLTGSGVMAIWFGIVNAKLDLHLRRSCRRLTYDAPIPIYLVEGLPSPCLYGLFHPAVYLTEAAVETPQEEEATIEHELTHWRHLDNLWSVARILCLIVYWFDPFVWLAAWLSKQDCELYCDDCTIRRIGEERRYEYGRTLLALSETSARPSDLICSASTMSGGAKRMRERIVSIANKPKRSILLSAAAVIIAFTAVICTFSSPSAALEATPMEVISTSPPLIVETPTPEEAMATLPPTPITETDTQEVIAPTPVPTQIPANTPTPAPVQNTSSASVSIEATYQEDTTNDETPSGGGGMPQTQLVQAASGGSTPTQTLPPEETEVPVATPPPTEAEPVDNTQIVVRDMRDVYMNSDWDPYPDMPSTVPDSPPPIAATDTPG